MYKNPEEFIKIEQIYNDSYSKLINSVPNRYDSNYKKEIKKILTEYFGKKVIFKKNIIKNILKQLSAKNIKLIKIYNTYMFDYIDIRNEYKKISNVIDCYELQRIKSLLTRLGDETIASKAYVSEINDPSFYKFKIINNYKLIRNTLKIKIINARELIKMQETCIKILKFIKKELNFILNYFFV